MFIHPLENGDILVRQPRMLAAWRIDGKHLEYLRRTQKQLLVPLALLALTPFLKGVPLAIAILAAVTLGSWKGLTLFRWLSNHGERVDYRTIPLQWYESHAVAAVAILGAAAALVAFIALAGR
jgi:hypothetical protein